MRIQHGFGILVEIIRGFDQPLYVLHRLLQNSVKLFKLSRQLLFSVLAGENGKKRKKLFLMIDGKLQHFGERVDVPQISVALLPGGSTVLMIDDIKQNGSVLLNFLPQQIVVVEDDDQRVLVEVLPVETDVLPPVLELLQHLLDLLLLMRLEVYLEDQRTELVYLVLQDVTHRVILHCPTDFIFLLE
jgi:hypothetical protein